MKLLLDACVWGGASTELQAAGHDVVWAGAIVTAELGRLRIRPPEPQDRFSDDELIDLSRG